jgi:hypothetical protein
LTPDRPVAEEPANPPGPTDGARPLAPALTQRRSWFRASLPGFLYPLEITVAFIVGISFVLGVSPHAIFRSLIIAVVGVSMLMLLATAILRDVDRAAVVMLLLVFLYLSLGTVILFALFILVVLAVILLNHLPLGRGSWARFSRAASSFASILLVIILVQGYSTGKLGSAIADLGQGGGLPGPDFAAQIDPTKPDIYVIILDGYARPDTLRTSFGFDDGPFLDQLESRGFDLASNSHSNYSATAETLVTMLDMDYLGQIPQVANLRSGEPAGDGQYRQAINHNKVFDLMRAQGYQVVATGSGWEQLALRQADVYMDGGQLNTFEAAMLSISGLGHLIQQVAPDWAGDQIRGRIDGTFEELRQVAETPSSRPRLVISHVLAPHPPLVYGPDGEHLRIDASAPFAFDWTQVATAPQPRAAYVGQVAYLNRQVLPVVDALTSSTRRPTVVVLMSDHGSRMDTPAGSSVLSPEADRNFFATLTPGHRGLFGDSPTPVNLFPHLLNAYLGMNLPILPDHSFVSAWSDPLNVTPLPDASSP